MAVKSVPFFPNTDSVRCQQACVKSVLKYFFPDKELLDNEIDVGTAQHGGTTWFPPAVTFLDEAGLSVQLHTPPILDYKEFAERGKAYLEEKIGARLAYIQEENGAFQNFPAVQSAILRMLEKNLVKGEAIGITELATLLNSPGVLAIGKTFLTWFSGIDQRISAHYAVIIKSYSQTNWQIHDPGPPGKPNRVVAKTFNGEPMFSEVLVIEGPGDR